MESINPYATPDALEGAPVQPQIPSTFGEILVHSVSLLLTNAPTVLGVSLIIWTPFELFRSYYAYFLADPELAEGSQFWIENLIGLWPSAAVMAIGHAAMKGERPSIWFGLRAGLQAWLPLLGTRIIVGILTLLAGFAFIIPAFYVAVRALLAEPATVAERCSGMSAMNRSFHLTQGAFWRHFFLALVAVIYFVLLAIVSELPALLWVLFDVEQNLLPDHWLVATASSLLIDLAISWPPLLYVVAYWAATRPGRSAPTEPLAFLANLADEAREREAQASRERPLADPTAVPPLS